MPKFRYYSRRTQNRLAKIKQRHLKAVLLKPEIASSNTSSTDSTGQMYIANKGLPSVVKYKASQSKPLPLFDGNRFTRSKNEVIKQLSRKLNSRLK